MPITGQGGQTANRAATFTTSAGSAVTVDDWCNVDGNGNTFASNASCSITMTDYWSCTGTTTASPTTRLRFYTTPWVETEEGRRQRLERERRQREEEREWRRNRVAAERRARRLLMGYMTKEQRQTYRKLGWFIVVGGYTGTRYRLRHGRARNIEALNEHGRVAHVLCAHPTDDVPDEDTLLAQKVMLEKCEMDFLAIANKMTESNARAMDYQDPPVTNVTRMRHAA